MSHIVTGKAKLTKRTAIDAACKRLGIAAPVDGSHKVYQTNVKGLGVKLPGWNYPVVIHPETGEMKFDNYHGSWGKQEELDKFQQAYEVERQKAAARATGYTVSETVQADGTVQLEVLVEA